MSRRPLLCRLPGRQQHLEVGAAEHEAEPVVAGIVFGRCALAGLFQQQPVAPAMEGQRRSVEIVEVDDFADDDYMVAAVVLVPHPAFEARGAAVQQRHLAMAALERDTGEFVGAALGETVRGRLLICGENMHREIVGGGETFHVGGRLAEAPQHHWRIERDRIEAVCRQAVVIAVRAACGHDRDAGGEGAERNAKLGLVDSGSHGRSP